LPFVYHSFQDTLKGHGVAAYAVGAKVAAFAIPLTMIVADLVVAVLSMQGDRELSELDAVAFLRVLLGLENLADHA